MLEGLMAPLRVVMQRSLADWLLVAATWLVILCAVTLLAIGVLYGDAVALSGLRERLAADPAATTIDVQMRVEPADLARVDEVVTRQSRRVLGWAGGAVVRTMHSGSVDLGGEVSGVAANDLGVVGALDQLSEHAQLLRGAWPDPGATPVEASLSVPAADRLGLDVSDRVTLTNRAGSAQSLQVVITGVWEPRDPGERFWVPGSIELTGMSQGSSFNLIGPFAVAEADLVAVMTGKLDVSWRTVPDFDLLVLDDVRWMRSDADALEGRVRAELGDDAFFAVTTALPGALRDADRSLLASRSGVLVLTIQFVILAGYALILVAGLLAEQRRVETALLRSRGAGPPHVLIFAALEALLLVVPAVLVAPWVAVAILALFNAVGPLAAAGVAIQPRIEDATLIVAGIAGIGAFLGLVGPAVLGGGRGLASVRQALGRQGSSSLAQRMGIDVALVVLAGVGLWQLRQYGGPLSASVRGDLGLDPLLVAAPALALVAGAILALRIVPLLAELGERVLGRRPGVVVPFGTMQLARRPLRFTRSALLLVLAAALATFAASYTETWTQSQEDQAAHRTGADLRVEVSGFPDLPDWAIGPAYRYVEGVDRALAVRTETFDVGGDASRGQLLAVDERHLADVAETRPDLLAGLDIHVLADGLAVPAPGLDEIPIPGEPTEIVLDISTSLTNYPREVGDGTGQVDFTTPVGQGMPIGRVSVVLRDGGGQLHVVDADRRLLAAADDQRVAVRLEVVLDDGRSVTPDFPLSLVGLEILVEAPPDTRIAGRVELNAVQLDDGSGDASSMPMDVAGSGWRWFTRQGAGELFPSPVEPAALLEISLDRPIHGDDGPVAARLASVSLLSGNGPVRLPAFISRSLADQANVAVGDELAIGSLTSRLQVRVAGVIDGFPTIDPTRPFAIVGLEGQALATYVRSGRTPFVNEWWLRVDDPARSDAIARILRQDPHSAERVTDQRAVLLALSNDPLSLGVIGALIIGAIAALVVAFIGFGVSAVVSTRERLSEFALLRAVGLSSPQLSAWLSLEFAFLLLIGAAAGSGLGLLLSWLVLPFVALTADARAAVPPVRVEVPWDAIVVIHLVAVAALVGSVVIARRVIHRVPVIGVLRSGSD